jgi:hypothetical protein
LNAGFFLGERSWGNWQGDEGRIGLDDLARWNRPQAQVSESNVLSVVLQEELAAAALEVAAADGQ